MIRRLTLALSLAAALLPGPASAAEGRFEINYIPFNFETFIAVTPENIAGASDKTVEVHPNDLRLKEVLAVIERAPAGPPLEEAMVRARIRYPDGRTAFIDQTGGLRFPDRDADLDERALDRLALLLASLTESRFIGRNFVWVAEAVHAHVAATEGWPRSAYRVVITKSRLDYEAGLVIANVYHYDDSKPGRRMDEVPWIGSDESFVLHFDPLSRDLVRQMWFQ